MLKIMYVYTVSSLGTAIFKSPSNSQIYNIDFSTSMKICEDRIIFAIIINPYNAKSTSLDNSIYKDDRVM